MNQFKNSSFYKIVVSFCTLAVLSCANFPTSYDRVDPDKIRMLDFIYEPLDAAPGDTVTCTAVFAGKEISPEDISWSVSWNVQSSIYGADSAYDIKPLEVQHHAYSFSKNTSTVRISYIIPEDFLLTTPGLALKNPTFRELAKVNLPDNFDISTIQVLFDKMASSAPTWKRTIAQGNEQELLTDTLYSMYEAIKSRLPVLTQLHTAQYRLFAKIQGAYVIESTQSARYNSKFIGLPDLHLHTNSNPVIDSIGIYKVKSTSIGWFDPKKQDYDYSFVRFDNTDTVGEILVEHGYSYFLAGFVSKFDTANTLTSAPDENAPDSSELLFPAFMFELDETERKSVDAKDFLKISNSENFITLIDTPKDKKIKNVTVWFEVKDYDPDRFISSDEIFKPYGSMLKEAQFKFVYTD